MTRVHVGLCAVLCSIGMLGGVGLAQAAPKTAPPSMPNQASLLLGYGFDDAYHFSLGARGLHQLENLPVTIGGSFNYYFGSGTDLPEGFTGPEPSVKSFTLLAEAGYALSELGGLPLMLRPYVGLGLFSASVDVGSGDSSSNNEFAFVPGVVAEYNLSPTLFIGGDLRLNIVNDNSSLALFGLVGMRF